MPAYPGPTANLPGYARRSGRSGTVWIDGRMRGEVVQVDWNVNIAQIPVLITGAWRTDQKPGGEERVGTFMVQDVDDHWALQVYNFVVARRRGDRTAAVLPEFSIITMLDDIGAPAQTRWQLDGCQLFTFSGGFDQSVDLLTRQIPFNFRQERPLDAYEYTDTGINVTQGVGLVVTDYEAAWIRLAAYVAGKTQHGREGLLSQMAEIAEECRVPAGELSRLLRLYGIEVERARSIATELDPADGSASSGDSVPARIGASRDIIERGVHDGDIRNAGRDAGAANGRRLAG